MKLFLTTLPFTLTLAVSIICCPTVKLEAECVRDENGIQFTTNTDCGPGSQCCFKTDKSTYKCICGNDICWSCPCFQYFDLNHSPKTGMICD